jgi:hypothetical protein
LQSSGRLGAGLLATRGQNDPVARLGQPTAGFQAKPPVGAGDQSDGLLVHGVFLGLGWHLFVGADRLLPIVIQVSKKAVNSYCFST